MAAPAHRPRHAALDGGAPAPGGCGPSGRPAFFQGFTEEHEVGLAALLAQEGYQPVRYFYQMVRPTLDDIPDFPLPAGLEVRPVLPEHYRAIWEADVEAFQDHWGYAPPTEEDYQGWLNSKTIFQPHLWQIAWDVAADQIAGQVRTFIDRAQNEKNNRRRGWTEFISVRRAWRRRGLARALVVLRPVDMVQLEQKISCSRTVAGRKAAQQYASWLAVGA